MKNFIIIFLLLLISCAARKSSVQKQSEKLDTATEQKTETKGETQSETSGETSYNLASDFMGFNIEPVNGLPAVFSFNYNGQKITGETTGKLNFSNEKKNEQIQTKYRVLTKTIYQTMYITKTQTIYEKDSKNKDTERKAFPWYLLILTGVVLTVGAQLLWKVYKPKLI